jgi:hypothetical protein
MAHHRIVPIPEESHELNQDAWTMARQKLGSRDLKNAKLRLGNLEAISPDLDLGDGLTLSAYAKVINKYEEKLKVYNCFLATLDGLRSELSIDLLTLRDFSD